jgi:hypothetical protein
MLKRGDDVEYKVKIIRTSVCEMILKADDDKELQDVVDEAIEKKEFNFDMQNSTFKVEVNPIE